MTWTMGYAPRHRLEEEATFTSGDGRPAWIGYFGIFGDCPSPMSLAQGHVTEDVVFFFLPSPRLLFWLRALVAKLTGNPGNYG